MSKAGPGSVFIFPVSAGYAVGLVTHDDPRRGPFVWIAQPIFEHQPAIEDIRTIDNWRWPVGFPMSAALRQKDIRLIGKIEVPVAMRLMPAVRSRHPLTHVWHRIEFVGEDSPRWRGPTEDRSLPIYQIVNGVTLRDLIESDYPRNDW
jgi:hypothetical protein